jgi:hypothetical protein
MATFKLVDQNTLSTEVTVGDLAKAFDRKIEDLQLRRFTDKSVDDTYEPKETDVLNFLVTIDVDFGHGQAAELWVDPRLHHPGEVKHYYCRSLFVGETMLLMKYLWNKEQGEKS